MDTRVVVEDTSLVPDDNIYVLAIPGSLLHSNVSLLGHVSKIVSILLSKLGDCPNTDTSLCYCNYPFLTVCDKVGLVGVPSGL